MAVILIGTFVNYLTISLLAYYEESVDQGLPHFGPLKLNRPQRKLSRAFSFVEHDSQEPGLLVQSRSDPDLEETPPDYHQAIASKIDHKDTSSETKDPCKHSSDTDEDSLQKSPQTDKSNPAVDVTKGVAKLSTNNMPQPDKPAKSIKTSPKLKTVKPSTKAVAPKGNEMPKLQEVKQTTTKTRAPKPISKAQLKDAKQTATRRMTCFIDRLSTLN